MSERWRGSVWRSARREPHIPDKQLNGNTWHNILSVLCYILLAFVSWENGNFCSGNILVIFFQNDSNAFILFFFFFLYQLVCFLAFSHLSSLTRLYPTPLVDVFFTDDLLWISNLQCSDCYRQQQCFSGAVKAVLPPCTAWKCDTSIPCSCQSIEEKVD